ncbi:MAG TPA: nucleoside triphosphate pyrophosphohydrolase [Chloroflexota bacterium]|nr:nucleoside triphosphate pyrophosphohydrolase [Chloroflexota bacterium]
MSITIVGLGPGNGRTLTLEAWQHLSAAEMVYVRTSRHPTVADLPAGVKLVSFDDVYDTAVSFEAVYTQIVETLLAHGRDQDIIYAVPGHPFVGESTVTRLVAAAAEQEIPVHIVPGLSFVEPSLTAVRVDALDGLQIFDAIDMARFHYPPLNPDVPVLLGQVYSRLLASELKMVLTAVYPPQHPVYLIHAAGTAGEQIESVPLHAIDHSPQIDHLSSLYVPALSVPSSLMSLAETVAHLRSPEGCPWDQEQTPQSMRADFLEEACEVLDALDADDVDGLREELGDLLYHILMQVQMAAEAEDFALTDVIAGIETKLKRRHPHVWGDWEVTDSDHVVRNWEMLKKQEKARAEKPASALDGVPVSLPALARSQKIQHKAGQVGFDWPDMGGVYAKLDEELAELKAAGDREQQAEELGDLLFVIVNLARWLAVDAESCLREANSKFSQRFQLTEQLARQRGLHMPEMSLPELDVLWEEAKSAMRDT